MAAAVALTPHGADNDLAEYHDAAVDEFRQELGFDANGPAEQNYASWNPDAAPAKDVDEEVQIKKKRKPVAKLDEARFLSADGIPRLRKIAKSRKAQFKGKGHEYSDIGNLLSTYQFWLDDLYPRAKFRDALAIIEKLGHSRRLQVTRRAWIDATKPQGRDASPERIEDETIGSEHNDVARPVSNDGPDDDAVMGETDQEHRSNDIPDDDDLDALLAEHEASDAAQRPQPPHRNAREAGNVEDGPDEDELNALMAEHNQTTQAPPRRMNMPFFQDDEDEEDPDQDELDALLVEQDQTSHEKTAAVSTPNPTAVSAGDSNEDGPDEEELDALMAEQDQTTPKANPEQLTLNSSQTISVGEDELDALMDEQEAHTQ